MRDMNNTKLYVNPAALYLHKNQNCLKRILLTSFNRQFLTKIFLY